MSSVAPLMISAAERCRLPFDTPCTLYDPTYSVPQDNQTVTSLVLDKAINTVNPDSHVCRGTLDGRRVIAKFAYDSNYLAEFMKSEADNYETLKALQGTCIPRFYMHRKGSILTSDDERPKDLSCIIIEDCGNKLPPPDEMKDDEKIEVFKQFVKFHLSGYYVHFGRENIVGSPGRYRIVDFHAIDGHDCPWEGFKENDPVSHGRPFPCLSLGEVGRYMEIWKKFKKDVMILGKSYYGKDAEEFPPKKIIPYLVPDMIPITFMDIGANRETVEESLKQFKKKMDEDPNCDIKELIDSYQKNSSYTLENSDGKQFRPRFMVYEPTPPQEWM
ncbi:hypothetical protein PNOK_0475800 [Pyrrhoderma noxium]|uniref:Proteophosphoglycan ppg4 n=1 Tax=Pyrrhoderma noxium TaxID=2282107 RepID=A0A286UK20_9AGAM|nr:hypothetical protein PNOK_0475800 [Pyrrhoderma noxium]